MILFVLTALLTAAEPVSFRGAEVYQPLLTREVLVGEDERVFILSFSEAKIHIYAADGTLTKTLGGKGKGPSEFSYPTQFWVEDGLLFVFDMADSQVTQFDRKGDFVKRWPAPGRHFLLEKVAGGWVYGNWNDFLPEDIKPTLMWADEGFVQTRKLAELTDAGSRSGLTTWGANGKQMGRFNPIHNQPHLLVASDKRHVYLSHTTHFKIDVFDAIQGKKVRTIERLDEKRIPFDLEWAEQQFAAATENRNINKVNWEKMYPKTFPIIRSMQWAPGDLLVVDRWRGKPESANHYLTLDTAGTVVDKTWNSAALVRFVATRGNHCYLTAWDSEEDAAFVVKVPKNEAVTWVTANPIKYDGPRSRDISFSQFH